MINLYLGSVRVAQLEPKDGSFRLVSLGRELCKQIENPIPMRFPSLKVAKDFVSAHYPGCSLQPGGEELAGS